MNSLASTSGLIQRLQSWIEAELRQHVTKDDLIALIGFPDYWNTGDSAIWLGTKNIIENLGCRLSYACGREDYNKAVMASRLGSGKILLLGGGNLGDIWPTEQTFRETIIQDFPGNKIIQLPQSIYFHDISALRNFKNLCHKHGQFHCMVRDLQSLQTASQELEVPYTLCPDMAYGLGVLSRTTQASTDILWLARTDKEKRANFEDIPSREHIIQDWVSLNQNELDASIAAENIRLLIRSCHDSLIDNTDEQLITNLLCAYDDMARLRLDRGLKILSQGRVVITDRLHGYILCLLLDIPHVAMDNSYGKVSNAIVTWTHTCSNSYFTNDSSVALAYAEKFLIASHNEKSTKDIPLIQPFYYSNTKADITVPSIESPVGNGQLEQALRELTHALNAEVKATQQALARIFDLEKEILGWLKQNKALTKEKLELGNALSETQAAGEKMRDDISHLESKLDESRNRQKLMNNELLKAEAQIDFIKELLIKEPDL